MEIKRSILLTNNEIERPHQGALTVLRDMGVRIEDDDVLDQLGKNVAKRDQLGADRLPVP